MHPGANFVRDSNPYAMTLLNMGPPQKGTSLACTTLEWTAVSPWAKLGKSQVTNCWHENIFQAFSSYVIHVKHSHHADKLAKS